MGKAMAAYTNLSVESVNDYPTIRQVILQRHRVNAETIGSSLDRIVRSLVSPTVSGQTVSEMGSVTGGRIGRSSLRK